MNKSIARTARSHDATYDRMMRTIATWRMRSRQRRALAVLDDHQLSDIGVGRVDAQIEAQKPFWLA